MSRTFSGQQEAAAHLHALCAHQQRSSQRTAIADTAGNKHRNALHSRQHVLHQRHRRLLANVTAGLHAFDNHRISTGSLNAFCQLHARYNRNNLDACCMEGRNMRHRIACAQGYEGHLLLAQHRDNLSDIRCHQHNIHAERLIGQAFCLTHLVTRPFHSAAAAANDACAAGIRNCCCQISVTRPRHTTLNHRIFNT